MHPNPWARADPRQHPGKRIALAACLFALAGLMQVEPAMAQSHTHQHAFRDAQKWAQVFDDPKRDEWQKPREVISALELPSDAVVADVGAGTGYFSARLARMLPRGVVYAVDIEPEMVKYLAERAQREGLPNMRPISGTPDDPRLPAQVDLILLVDTYHHIDQRERYFSKLRALLKPGGRLAVIDFKLESPTGPPKEVRIAPGTVKRELTGAGYSLEKEHSFLPHQYFLVFTARR
jgi:SAM-dependent methyltransferase